MWFIGVEVAQETSAPPLKKNPGSAPETEQSKCTARQLSFELIGVLQGQLFTQIEEE